LVAVVVAVCATSAGVHAGLVPQHLAHEPRLGAAFIATAPLLLAVAAALTYRPTAALVGAAALIFAALIAAYALSVTTGLPWLSSRPEPVDAVGMAAKTVEALGLVFSIHLSTAISGRGSLTHQEVRT